jgi:DNA-binding NarL/FixJ family response regulator
MARLSKTAADLLASAPPLPLDGKHWRKVVTALGLSDQQARVAELVLRDLCNKQIAAVMGISESTIDTYMQRIGQRTGTSGRMQLAMHVMAVSHQVRR